jgi:N-acetylglucosaminyldiphosphoundecaprenol N-acetyl-beta-D-mannosaminyltransferase
MLNCESAPLMKSREIFIGPVRISPLGLKEAIGRLDEMLRNGGRHYLCFCEANSFVHAYRTPEVAEVLNRSGMTLADGVLLVVLARLLGCPLPQRVPGPSFMLAACEHGVVRGYRHFFYGGDQGVAEELAERLRRRFPGLIVAGTYSPPFRPLKPEEEEQMRKMIEVARPDLLWVGLGGSKQVFWMANHINSMNVPIMLGVGAAFDFHSGRVPWAPRWIRSIGLEWAFRTLTGGRRTFYRNLWCLPQSLLVAFREIWRVRVLDKLYPE